MKLRKLIVAMFLALVGCLALHGQVVMDCDRTVSDYAGVLNGKSQQVADAARDLIAEGADLRVLTVPSDIFSQYKTLDNVAEAYRKICASWQSPNRGIKNNLLVLMDAPTERKMAILFAKDGTLAAPLNAHQDRIKKDYMAPAFKSGDFAGGFIAAEKQLAKRLAAAKDEALHPNVSTTVNQAADLSGLWKVMKVFLLLVGFGLACWAIYFIFTQAKKIKRDIAAAQRRAIDAKNNAGKAVRGLKYDSSNNAAISQLSEDLSALAALERMNPDTPGLLKEDYEAIAARFNDIYTRAATIKYPDLAARQGRIREETREAQHRASRHANNTPAPSVVNNTVFVDNYARPVESIFVERPVYVERSPAPVFVEPTPVEPAPEPVSGSSWGGNSSGYGEDSNSSSSSNSDSEDDSY